MKNKVCDFIIIKKDMYELEKGVYEIVDISPLTRTITFKSYRRFDEFRIAVQPSFNPIDDISDREFYHETTAYKILKDKEVHKVSTEMSIHEEDMLYNDTDEAIKLRCMFQSEEYIKDNYVQREPEKDKEFHIVEQRFTKHTSDRGFLNTYRSRIKFIVDVIDWSGFRNREEYNDYHQI
jgi:hypothetical protein